MTRPRLLALLDYAGIRVTELTEVQRRYYAQHIHPAR
jgi:hypothetical protein